MIEVKGLQKNFGFTEAVKGIDFSVPKGDIVGLLGPNGAGKTTTMRMITGYYKPGNGEVRINGVSVEDGPIEAKRIIGYLPETSCTYSDMLVCDYLDFIADSRMLSSQDKKRGIESSVESTSLHEYYYMPISKLSKGYKQRVGIASTLVHDPEILILDEPTSGLDPNQIKEIQKLIRNLSKNKTIILSTHILSEVEATCERAIIIDQGKIVLDKSLQEISLLKTGDLAYMVTLKGEQPSALEVYQNTFNGSGEIVELASSASGKNTTLRLVAGEDAAEKIFNLAVEKKYTLLALYSERSSLEDVFASLTSGA